MTLRYWMVRVEWDHCDRSSIAEVFRDGEYMCSVYATVLPDLRSDNPGFWSLDVPAYDEATESMKLRPQGMGRAADLEAAINDAEAAVQRFCGGVLELVA